MNEIKIEQLKIYIMKPKINRPKWYLYIYNKV